jgi:hypothetical protein
MIKNTTSSFFILEFLPTTVFAKMGHIFPDSSGGGEGVLILFWIIIIGLVFFSYIGLVDNIKDWRAKRERNEKIPKLKLTLKDFEPYLIFGLLFFGFFISLPFLFWISKYGVERTQLEDGIFVYIVAISILFFFRRP